MIKKFGISFSKLFPLMISLKLTDFYKLSFFPLIVWVRFPYCSFDSPHFFFNNLFCLFIFLWFLTFFFIDFDGYYIVRTDESQPRPKYIFNKCGTNIYLFTLPRGLVYHHHRILTLLAYLCLRASTILYTLYLNLSLH